MALQKRVEAEAGKDSSRLKKLKRGDLTVIEITEETNDLRMMKEEKKGMTTGIEVVATEIKTNVITEVGTEEGKNVVVTDMTNATNGIIVTMTTKTVVETTGAIGEMRAKERGPEKIVTITTETVARKLFRK